MASSADRELVSKFGSFFETWTWHMRGRSGNSLARFDNSMGRWWIRPRAGHSQAPDATSLLWPAALTLGRTPLGIQRQPPNPKKLQRAHPKSTFRAAPPGFSLSLSLSVPLRSRRANSDETYCTRRQKKRQPSLWATDRPCLDWKDFDGAERGGGCCTQKLVSPGQPLWLSVPAQSSPSHPTNYPFSFFFSPLHWFLTSLLPG